MSRPLRIFFATDLHGSEICFRKFVSAAEFYNASVLFLGGDLSGKAMVPFWRARNGTWETRIGAETKSFRSKKELDAFEQKIADQGMYTLGMPEQEYIALPRADKTRTLEQLICKRLKSWLEYAHDRLSNKDVRIIAIPGNDDPPCVDASLDGCELVSVADRRILVLEDGLQVVGLGCSNPTPWHTYREFDDRQIKVWLDKTLVDLQPGRPTVFHFHVPPFGSGLDLAPTLDEDLKPIVGPGGPMQTSVGSHSVRQAIESWQPELVLSGHVHESRAFTRIGRSLCFNPGSDYSQGRLLGLIVVFQGQTVSEWQFTDG